MKKFASFVLGTLFLIGIVVSIGGLIGLFIRSIYWGMGR